MTAVKNESPLSEKLKRDPITEGPIFSSILLFVIPIILANVMQTLFNAVDMAMVNFFSVGNEVASIGSTGPILHLFRNLSIGISVGTSVLLARYLGAKDEEKTKKTVSSSILTSLLIGALIAAFSIPLMKVLLTRMNCPPECFEEAWLYAVVNMAGMPAILLYNYCSAILRVSGDSKRPLYYMLCSGGINVVLNLVFCILFASKILAVALATVLSQAIGAALSLFRLCRVEGSCRVSLKNLRMDFRYFFKILRYGLPNGICLALFAFSNILIYSALNEFGAATVAGESAAAQLQEVSLAVNSAFQVAAQTFIGQNLGAGNPKRVKKSFLYCGVMLFAITFSLGLFMNIFAEQLLYPFIGTNPESIYCGKLSTFYLAFFFFLYSTPFPATIQAFGYPTLQMSVNLAGVLGFRTLWMTFVYGKLLPEALTSIYFCYPISYALLDAVYIPIVIILFVKYKKGRLKKEL